MMTDERKGQIALLLVRHQLREKGVRLTPNLRRQVGNEAKEIGISTDEAMEFTESIIRELLDEAFPKTKKK